jgi:ribosome-associated heat shock protein Hsp15
LNIVIPVRGPGKVLGLCMGVATVALVIPASETERVDKWTRSLATDACRAGSVAVNGQPAKASREVRAGEMVVVRQGLIHRTLAVLGVPRTRVSAKIVAGYCDDRTPPEEFEKVRRQPVQQFLARAKGAGRPTKRDRRLLDQLLG